MSESTTKAGKVLLLDWEEWRQSQGRSAGKRDPFAMRERITVIEAEACEQERKRIRQWLERYEVGQATVWAENSTDSLEAILDATRDRGEIGVDGLRPGDPGPLKTTK